MPVRLEHIHTPAADDWVDIGKIHQDTAHDGLVTPPNELKCLLNSGSWIIAARFNDRIVGLMLAKEDEVGIHLSQAAVRHITQRRGVMHQLLHLLQCWAQAEGKRLVTDAIGDWIHQSLKKRHFCLYNGKMVYQPESR